MRTSLRGPSAPHAVAVAELMRARGFGIAELRWHSMSIGRPISRTSVNRVLGGEVPLNPLQRSFAEALSDPDAGEVVTASQLFGPHPLPRWAAEHVYGAPAAVVA